MPYNQQAILTYLSSSELNRCKKNGYNLFEPCDGWRVIGLPWITKKLRRKIGHLWQLDILPKLPPKPIIGVFTTDTDYFWPLFNIVERLMEEEDKIIMNGELPHSVRILYDKDQLK